MRKIRVKKGNHLKPTTQFQRRIAEFPFLLTKMKTHKTENKKRKKTHNKYLSAIFALSWVKHQAW